MPKSKDGDNQMGSSNISSFRDSSLILGSKRSERNKLQQTSSQIIVNSANNSKVMGGTRLYLKGT